VFLDKNSIKLLKYQASIDQQITYDRKADYFLLIHEYLTRVITLYEFQSKLVEMEKEDSRKSNRILDLDKFSSLRSRISDLCLDLSWHYISRNFV
jgi:hypothetical protein